MAGNLTAMIAAAFSGGAAPPVTSDPYFEYTTLLLPGNGTNGAQNNTFLDGSTNNFTITRNGNTTQGTFSPFSQTGWGNYFSGSSQYLSLSDNAAFAFGSGDLTVECWVYATTSGLSQGIAGQANSSVTASATSFILYLSSISKITVEFYVGSTLYLVTSSNNLVYNQWNHIAVVRDGGTIRLYINGQQDGTVAISGTINDSTNQLAIGRPGEYNSWYWNGYISNFRIVKGRCVYPSGTSFIPPTSPLTRTTGGTNPPQGTECSLLTCQSNSFLDSNGVNVPASSPLTITANGSPTVVAFSPFNPSASWSAATYGGSGYFDGSGDYLGFPVSSAFTLGTNDFTIEGWLYPNTLVSGVSTAFVLDSNAYPRVMWYYVGGVFTVHVSTTGAGWDITQTCSVLVNQWNHLVLQRNGNDFRTFLNGSLAATTTASLNIPAQRSVGYVGRGDGGSQIWNGYVSGLRVVNGTAVYNTSGFTPPTSPPTAITNTSLLLNFTNAGIYDATSKNDLETVGNAQISTTQSKWGGSSIYLDGTGDYLACSSGSANPLFNMGTGDYTVEFWMYSGTPSSQQVIFDMRNSDTSGQGIAINYTTSRTLTLYMLGVRITSSAISANTWTHVAIARASGTYTMYVGGSSAGTWVNSDTVAPPANRPYVGSDAVGSQNFNGYMQDLRITKGYARYTTNFTPPTAAFPTL